MTLSGTFVVAVVIVVLDGELVVETDAVIRCELAMKMMAMRGWALVSWKMIPVSCRRQLFSLMTDRQVPSVEGLREGWRGCGS